MRKTWLLLVLTALIAVLTVGCGAGQGGKAADLSPADVADAILEQVDFKQVLVLAEGDSLENRYLLDDKVTDYAIYYDAGGGSAEEIAVLKGDAGDIKHLVEILNQRLETLAFSFESYRPNEMQKIKNPVIIQKGGLIVMVLTDDVESAEDVISSILDQKK